MASRNGNGTPAKIGRPPIHRTDANRATVLALARLTLSVQKIADMLGCDRSTLFKWMTDVPEFRAEFEAAKAEPFDKASKAVIQALDSDDEKVAADMAKWLLERRGKGAFDLRQKHEVTVESKEYRTVFEQGAPRAIIEAETEGDDNERATNGDV